MNSSALSRVGHFWFSECILLWYIWLTGDGRVLSEQHLPCAEARQELSRLQESSKSSSFTWRQNTSDPRQNRVDQKYIARVSPHRLWGTTCNAPGKPGCTCVRVRLEIVRAFCETHSAAACVLPLCFCFSFLEALWARTRGVTRQGKEDGFSARVIQ